MSWDFGASWCQNSWFGEPLGGQECPKWRPRSPKWYTKGCATHVALILFGGPRTDLLPRSLSERSSKQFWSVLGPPWHQNHGISQVFSSHFDDVLYIISGHRFAFPGVTVVNFRWFQEAFPHRFLIKWSISLELETTEIASGRVCLTFFMNHYIQNESFRCHTL